MVKLIPDGELTFHDWESCETVMDVLLSEGYVLLLSREESLYVVNYIWSDEDCPDRNDVVFMNRAEFEGRYYEDPDYEEDRDYAREDRIREETRRDTERQVWWYAKKLLDASPATIEKMFGLEYMSEEAQDRFWGMYPNQITYEEAKKKVDEYQELKDAALAERIMDACLADLDQYNAEKYDRIMRKEECETTDYSTALNDTLPSA